MQPPILSVYELNARVKSCLETALGSILLTGEISNFMAASSGHWYFSLKDERAQVRCAMFRGANSKTGFLPKNGQKVIIKANVTLYEARGEYQLIVSHLQLDGIGNLQQRYEELKLKLQQAGYFNQEHKKPLPKNIKTVGVITSQTGAAFHDICTVLKRRDPNLTIILYPTLVQGNLAAENIAKQIKTANVRRECDVLIIGRGGGSLEDLWAFNEKIVAGAIFNSQIVTVSAVGHEIDFTISDFIADLRAPTPSAAAELVSQDRQQQLHALDQQQTRLNLAFDYFLMQKKAAFSALSQKLERQHPKVKLMAQFALLQNLNHHLKNGINQHVQRAQAQWFKTQSTLSQSTLVQKTAQFKARIAQFESKMALQMQQTLNRHQAQIETAHQALRYLLQDRWFAAEKRQTALLNRVLAQSPRPQLIALMQKQTEWRRQLDVNIQQCLIAKKHQLQLQAATLHSVSPLSTLARGYSVAQDAQKNVIQSTKQVHLDEVLTTRLKDGWVKSRVVEVAARSKSKSQ